MPRAPIERAMADLKVRRVLRTGYRRSPHAFHDAFRAVIGLYVLEEAFA